MRPIDFHFDNGLRIANSNKIDIDSDKPTELLNAVSIFKLLLLLFLFKYIFKIFSKRKVLLKSLFFFQCICISMY